jgi:hypothetical protein
VVRDVRLKVNCEVISDCRAMEGSEHQGQGNCPLREVVDFPSLAVVQPKVEPLEASPVGQRKAESR